MLLILLTITICQAGHTMSQCSNCQECDTYGRCTRCTEGFVLVADKCVKCNIATCRSCSEQGKCDICEPGYFTHIYSNYVQCIRCSNWCTSCSSWTECVSCENAYGWCIYCSSICDSCSQRGTCDNCKDGYYVTSNQGCNRCQDNCKTCSDRKNCHTCIYGYYLQNSDCIKCPEQCETCTSETICDSCKVGYYLNKDVCLDCRKECVDCIDYDICRKCLPRYYLSSRGVCEACPGTCSSCTSVNACHSCDKGYYGTICERTCSDLCKDQQCRQSDGICDSGCISGYYMDYSRRQCNECHDNCETCRSRYACDTCKIGFYGYQCYNKCPEECSSRECNKDNGECSKGCVVGYYGNRCNYNCSEGCSVQACFQGNGTCMNGCIDGYYGTQYGKCRRCHEFCINRQCKEIYGSCTTGCIHGYYEHQGQCYKCPVNCQTCSSQYICTSCIDGFYKSSCNTPCINCLPGGCSFYNGICKIGCRAGFYQGETSCLHCPRNCAKCTSTEYCDVCKYGYFGRECEHKCSFYCQACDDIDSCSLCNKETGHCMNCTYDTFGQLCDHNCSTNCFRTSHAVSSCFQQNGTCLYGCAKGFTGHNCTEEIAPSEQHTMAPEMTAMTLGGLVLLVLAATGLFLLVRRRRNQETKSPRNLDSNRQHARCTIQNPTYNAASGNDETMSRSDVKPDAADHVYAVVQKKSLRNQTSEIDKSIADDNVYDVSSTDKPSARIQRFPKTGTTVDDTYSHISHVNKAGRLDYGHHIDEETVYDHVAHDLVHLGNEMTYDIARSNQGQPCE